MKFSQVVFIFNSNIGPTFTLTGFNHRNILAVHEPVMAKEILRAGHGSKAFSKYAYGLSAGRDIFIFDNALPEQNVLRDLAMVI